MPQKPKQYEHRKKNLIIEFDKWLPIIGEGKCNKSTTGNEIIVQEDILLDNNGDHKNTIANAFYLDLKMKIDDEEYLCKKAILTPKNETVADINTDDEILHPPKFLTPSTNLEYLSTP